MIELLEVVGPLTDPTAHGGAAEDAFDLVLPSLPGYGFSGRPTSVGWDPARIARAWAELMQLPRLHPLRRPGRRPGRRRHRRDGQPGTRGPYRYPPELPPSRRWRNAAAMPAGTEEERAAAAAITTFRTSGFGYFLEQTTRPQTIGYALLDSPVALAAWMLDHDTDSYYKISSAFVDGKPSGNLTRDHILDNISLYWLTGTGASAARSYWEGGQAAARAAGHAPPPTALPVGFTTFPGRDLPGAAQLGRGLLPQRRLFQRGRTGRSLRRLGRARSSSRPRCARRSARCDSRQTATSLTEVEMSTSAPQAPGITRVDLQEHDLSVPGRRMIQNRVEISPEAQAFRH